MSPWHILYRGPLSSCNYRCGYCPFAKTAQTRSELRRDRADLDRFVAWAGRQERRLGILFTPWGEALVHAWYRRALVALSRLPRVYRVSIQTNLSGPLAELVEADRGTLALWTTFHPSQVPAARFGARCRALDAAGIRYSVGVVGAREHFDAIEELRRLLRPEVYLWINALEGAPPGYYQARDVRRLLAVDPHFHWNLRPSPSRGKPCATGHTAFTVDGHGDVRRCHFVPEVLGNLYQPGFDRALRARPCPVAQCTCHIGYIFRPDLKLDELYGPSLLERIPARWPA